jgi:ribose 5-phosphate isomerase B
MTLDARSGETTIPGISLRSPLRIIVGSDSAGHEYKTALKTELEKNPDVAVIDDVGVMDAEDGTAYPHIAVRASEMIMAGHV